MLQQTQVDTVIPYYRRFIKVFPSVRALARARLQDVLAQWEGLGYYARARNLHKAAGIIVKEHGGRVPGDPALFRKLPGAGDYTTAAVLSIAYGEALPVVDGNVIRVVSRLRCMGGDLRTATGRRQVHEMAGMLLVEDDPGASNQAIMELGATVCTPRTPRCPVCPVSRLCKALKSGNPLDYPESRPRKPLRHETVAVGLVRDRRGRMLIARRPEEGLLGGLWEFPGGKVESGETPSCAVVREVKEELGIEVRVVREVCRVRHAYSHFKVTLHAFDCVTLGGRPQARGCLEWRWIRPDELGHFPFPRANRKILETVKAADQGT